METAMVVTNSIGMPMRLILAGTFVMGDDGLANNPPHTVTLTTDFRIGVYPVTNAQFRLFRPDHDSGEFAEISLDGDDLPVTQVSWDDANEFCAWLSAKETTVYRLPTEAEWEYCCRAGRSHADSRYPWGATWPPTGKAGNYRDMTAARVLGLRPPIEGYDDGYAVSSPVGQFDPNPWGLYDMGGNVWEWCLDALDNEFCTRDATDPFNPTGIAKVLRGSSWYFGRGGLRSAARYGHQVGVSTSWYGFRVAAEIPAEIPPSAHHPPDGRP